MYLSVIRIASCICLQFHVAYTLCGYASFDSTIRYSEQALFTRRTGITVVDFADDDSRIVYSLPQFVIRGLLGSERRVEVSGPCALYYEKYNLVLDLLFDPPQSFVIFGSRVPSDRFQGVLYELRDQSKRVFSGAFAERGNAFFGAPDNATTLRVCDCDDKSDAFFDAEEYLAGEDADNNMEVSAEDAGTSIVTPAHAGNGVEVKSAISPGNIGYSVGHDGVSDVKHGVNCSSSADPDKAPIELRSDREIQNSVTSAWQVTKNGTTIDSTDVDESSSFPELSRKIIALASGSFVSHMDVGGLRIWDLDTPLTGLRPVPLDEVLPSDSRLRPDLIELQNALQVDDSSEGGHARRNELLEKAQIAKDKLEDEKRGERRIRRMSEHTTDPFFPKCLLDAVTK